MTGRQPIDDAALAERLTDLAGEIAWPEAADVARQVTLALEARTAGRAHASGRFGRPVGWLGGAVGAPRGRLVRRSLVLALVVLLAIAVGAIAIGIGVPGIRIILQPGATPLSSDGAPPGSSSPTSPSATLSSPGSAGSPAPGAVSPGPTEFPTPPGSELGPIVTLDQARSDAGFELLVPSAAGYSSPAEVHLIGAAPFTRVTFSFPNDTLLTQFLGEIQPDAFQKIVGGGTTVTPVRVGETGGWWIAGAPHELMLAFTDPDGQVRWQDVTVSGNVLLWQRGHVSLRLETPLGLTQAKAVAISVH